MRTQYKLWKSRERELTAYSSGNWYKITRVRYGTRSEPEADGCQFWIGIGKGRIFHDCDDALGNNVTELIYRYVGVKLHVSARMSDTTLGLERAVFNGLRSLIVAYPCVLLHIYTLVYQVTWYRVLTRHAPVVVYSGV